MKILQSPSSLVFLVLTLAVSVFTYMSIVEPKDFVMLTTMAFMHYFKKPNESKDVQSAIQI